MCLAVPMQVMSVDGQTAEVSMQGIKTEVALDLVENVSKGDYVIVHAGFAIQVLSNEEAKETLAIFERLRESGQDPS